MERTPCLWITWITDACKRAGVRPDALDRVGCRECLHLGYLSQYRRRTSAWLVLDRIFSRSWFDRPRYNLPDETGEAIVKGLGRFFRDKVEALVAQVNIVQGENSG